MFKWLLFWRKKQKTVNLLPVKSSDIVDVSSVEIVVREITSFKDLFIQALQEGNNKRLKEERKVFSDEKVKTYFCNVVKHFAERSTKDGAILVSWVDIGLPSGDHYNVFERIFKGVCKEIELPVKQVGVYISVEASDFREFAEKFSSEETTINIDEKVRNLLHSGVYR